MLRPGTLFAGRYEVLRCISAGGMGTVYEVLHRETRRRRALKVMLADMLKDADLRRRFALEAQVTAEVESEHIVETFDAGVDTASGCPFLVMELLRGEDLGARLGRLSRLSSRETVGLLAQAARALDRTHAASIVHRDLKPENLFVTRREDGTLRLKVLDFGIAKVVRQTQVGKATRSMGTPLYMAPEQLDGEPHQLGPAADRYALAQIAYTLLVGEPYWAEEARALQSPLALMKKVVEGATDAPSARAARRGAMLPPAIDAWFLRATSVDPAARFADARSQVVELADVLGVADAVDAPLFGTVPVEPATARRGTPVEAAEDENDAVASPPAAAAISGPEATTGPDAGGASGAALSATTIVPTDPPPRRRGTLIAAALAVLVGVVLVVAALRDRGASGPAPAGESSLRSPDARGARTDHVPVSPSTGAASAPRVEPQLPVPSALPTGAARPPARPRPPPAPASSRPATAAEETEPWRTR